MIYNRGIMKPNPLIWNDIKGELLRKSIHMMVSFTPLLASYNLLLTLYLLSGGILFFTLHEYLRLTGVDKNSLLSKITVLASRERDMGHIVLGPITLGLGAFLSLILFPDPISSIAIYSLAFGDGLASLAGKLFGKNPLSLIPGKTLQGSLTCFFAVFISVFVISGGKVFSSILLALTATFLEVIPVKDIDNILIPLGTGLTAIIIGI